MVGVTIAAAVAAGVTGCSNTKSGTNSSGSSSAASSAAPPGPQLSVDGQQQNVTGAVTCNTANNTVTIGVGDASTGVGAVLSTDNPPIVHAVGLGTVNGVALGFSDAAPGQGSNAGAAVSGKSYTIKGTASGTDMSNPQAPQQVNKTFELDVTCPP
ncbi:MAG: lipoprotein LpqH [Mycobacterium sp.]|nr:lipoprotein LpqH [Mycobacterium sp.]